MGGDPDAYPMGAPMVLTMGEVRVQPHPLPAPATRSELFTAFQPSIYFP